MPSPSMPDEIRSFWIASEPYATHPRLERDLGEDEVDVAIVGGGITGITAAVLLARAGKRVVLLEGRRLAQGATGYTTAHLTEAIDTRYQTLVRDFGKEGAALAASASRAAIERIAAFIDEGAIACGFRRLPGYLFTEDEKDLEALHAEYEAARDLGLAVEMTREVPLPFPARAGVRFENQAELHARAYLEPLCNELLSRGGRVFEETRVRDVEEGEPCRVVTENGQTVRARPVITATNVPLSRFKLQTRLSHRRSYVVGVTTAEPALDGLFWDTAEPYHYLRSVVAPGSQHALLIVGGADHKTGTEGDTERCFEHVLSYTKDRFDVVDVGFHWAGQVIETSDGLPFIGSTGGNSSVLVATGYSGNGMTFGTAAGMLLSDLVLGIENPWTKLFDPTRVKPLASAASFAIDNAEVAYHFVADRLRRPDATDLAEVAPGEGKIVRVDGKRLAVFRDASGALQCLSPVCPHLGCHVRFNDAEKTWDCPCHGSRFDTAGTVLDGPAARGLERMDVKDGR